ncbi:MAG: hypothetical protein IJO58_04070 [Clostridia bacterium]|nr:hypothetical protein [Clostridia bacterium]
MKRLSVILLCMVVAFSFSSCNLRSVVDFYKEHEKSGSSTTSIQSVSSQSEEIKLDDGGILFNEGRVSSTASIEFKDSDGNILLDASDIFKASAIFHEYNGYFVQLELTETGTLKFADTTENNIGKKMGVYIDGELIFDPTVNDKITDGVVIISDYKFTKEDIVGLVDRLTK